MRIERIKELSRLDCCRFEASDDLESTWLYDCRILPLLAISRCAFGRCIPLDSVSHASNTRSRVNWFLKAVSSLSS